MPTNKLKYLIQLFTSFVCHTSVSVMFVNTFMPKKGEIPHTAFEISYISYVLQSIEDAAVDFQAGPEQNPSVRR